MLDLVLQAWGINWMNHYLIPAPLLCKLASSRIRTSVSIDCISIKEYPTLIQWSACRTIFWSASLAVLEIWNTVSFTVGGKETTELSWVAHNKRCVLPTSLWMDTVLEAKFGPKSGLLSVLHKNKVRQLRGKGISSVIFNLTNCVHFWFPLLNCSWNNDRIQHLTYQSLQLNGWRNCKTQLQIHKSYLLTHSKVYAILATLLQSWRFGMSLTW